MKGSGGSAFSSAVALDEAGIQRGGGGGYGPAAAGHGRRWSMAVATAGQALVDARTAAWGGHREPAKSPCCTVVASPHLPSSCCNSGPRHSFPRTPSYRAAFRPWARRFACELGALLVHRLPKPRRRLRGVLLPSWDAGLKGVERSFCIL
ncbi:hypothetical protein E2562_020966 [Oryza meyeriana var. granulata]|uniref:Uncharacterized protein n=1 Tax=Oryza meyeriana var. granulata TaxID=110450 RepID=A0A6G1DXK0_9ORYZ|nr:hypothetical protein E2562_020966 [Oryza meyeriana var. granulata]